MKGANGEINSASPPPRSLRVRTEMTRIRLRGTPDNECREHAKLVLGTQRLWIPSHPHAQRRNGIEQARSRRGDRRLAIHGGASGERSGTANERQGAPDQTQRTTSTPSAQVGWQTKRQPREHRRKRKRNKTAGATKQPVRPKFCPPATSMLVPQRASRTTTTPEGQTAGHGELKGMANEECELRDNVKRTSHSITTISPAQARPNHLHRTRMNKKESPQTPATSRVRDEYLGRIRPPSVGRCSSRRAHRGQRQRQGRNGKRDERHAFERKPAPSRINYNAGRIATKGTHCASLRRNESLHPARSWKYRRSASSPRLQAGKRDGGASRGECRERGSRERIHDAQQVRSSSATVEVPPKRIKSAATTRRSRRGSKVECSDWKSIRWRSNSQGEPERRNRTTRKGRGRKKKTQDVTESARLGLAMKVIANTALYSPLSMKTRGQAMGYGVNNRCAMSVELDAHLWTWRGQPTSLSDGKPG